MKSDFNFVLDLIYENLYKRCFEDVNNIRSVCAFVLIVLEKLKHSNFYEVNAHK